MVSLRLREVSFENRDLLEGKDPRGWVSRCTVGSVQAAAGPAACLLVEGIWLHALVVASEGVVLSDKQLDLKLALVVLCHFALVEATHTLVFVGVVDSNPLFRGG